MKLSIVIVSWNTRVLLIDCIKSIYAGRMDFQYEIWVVDNVSTDGSAEAVRENFPEVHLITNTVNKGFARANNQALRECGGEYLLLLNPDTLVAPDALHQLVDFMDHHPGAGASGSMLLNPDSSLQTSCYVFPTLTKEFWRLFHLDTIHTYGIYDMRTWDTDHPRPVEVIQGASLILRKKALDQVGLFDEDYFIYTEEVDLCYRLKKSGWGLFWVPASKVVHYGGQSTRQAATKMFLMLYQTKLIFFRKHYGQLAGGMYKLILLLVSISRIPIRIAALFQKQPKRDQSLRVADNYFTLLKNLPTM